LWGGLEEEREIDIKLLCVYILSYWSILAQHHDNAQASAGQPKSSIPNKMIVEKKKSTSLHRVRKFIRFIMT